MNDQILGAIGLVIVIIIVVLSVYAIDKSIKSPRIKDEQQEIKVGEIYKYVVYSSNPFKDHIIKSKARVIESRRNYKGELWVKYKVLGESGGTYEEDAKLFLCMYEIDNHND